MLVAGITLAALAIPATMGYTRIAGRPVTTGFEHDPDPDRRVRDLGVLQAPGGHFNHYPWAVYYAFSSASISSASATMTTPRASVIFAAADAVRGVPTIGATAIRMS